MLNSLIACQVSVVLVSVIDVITPIIVNINLMNVNSLITMPQVLIGNKQISESVSVKRHLSRIRQRRWFECSFRGAATQNTVMINNCQFVNNSAI